MPYPSTKEPLEVLPQKKSFPSSAITAVLSQNASKNEIGTSSNSFIILYSGFDKFSYPFPSYP